MAANLAVKHADRCTRWLDACAELGNACRQEAHLLSRDNVHSKLHQAHILARFMPVQTESTLVSRNGLRRCAVDGM